MRDIHFIVNEQAGRGKAKAVWLRVQHQLRTSGITNYAVSSIADLANLSPVNPDTVLVAIGGDGTVRAVGERALHLGLPMAVIPAGTGNDFVKNAALPTDLDGALAALLAGQERTIDAMSVNGVVGLNITGFGLDAAVVAHVETSRWLKRLGKLSYSAAMPGTLLRYQPFTVDLCFADGERVTYRDVFVLAVANGQMFGGGMRLVPHARVDDRVLDVCVVSGISKLEVLRLFPRIFSGAHVHHPSVHFHRTAAVDLTFTEGVPWGQTDGELLDRQPVIRCRLEPAGVRLLAPR